MLHPALYDDPVVTQKARLLLVCCIAAGSAVLVLVLAAYGQSPDRLVPQLIIATGHLLVCSSALLLRVSRDMSWPAHAITVLLCLQLVNAAWWTGGSASSVLYTYPIAAVVIGMLGTRKHALSTAVFLSTTAGAFYWLQTNGHDLSAAQATPEIMLGTLIWSILTGGGMAIYASYQTDTLLRIAIDEVMSLAA